MRRFLRTVAVGASSNGLTRVSITAHLGATTSTDNTAPAVYLLPLGIAHICPATRCVTLTLSFF